ncbi:MAG: hypothetical protein NTY20_03575 [Candidatus Aenigmarchaeota archaeon]|nr:hypothetical protein [Candidatus Aenigmarchaeota archaeon]
MFKKMFKKSLIVVAILVLAAVPAFALDGQTYGGGAGSESAVRSGSGAMFFGSSSSFAGNASGASAQINWGGPQVSANMNTYSVGGTSTRAFGASGAIAGQSGSASAGGGFHGFHIGF